MMVVDYQTQPTFSVGKPRVLFEGNYVGLARTGRLLFGDTGWAALPDGEGSRSGGSGSHANQRGAELVRGIEAKSPGEINLFGWTP